MNLKQFMTAGNATFTVEIPPAFAAANDTPAHYTFNIRKKEASGSYGEAWFASLLTGPNNETDFTYVGMFATATGGVRLTKGSKFTPDSIAYQLLCRITKRVWEGNTAAMEAAGFVIHHEGQCGRCGRALTVPESVESGFGPECVKLVMGCGRTRRKAGRAAESPEDAMARAEAEGEAAFTSNYR